MLEDAEAKFSEERSMGLKSGKRARSSKTRESLSVVEELPKLRLLEKERRERLNCLLRDERLMIVRVRETNERAEQLRSLQHQSANLNARLLELKSESTGTVHEIESKLRELQSRIEKVDKDVDKCETDISSLKKALDQSTEVELKAARDTAKTESHLANLINETAQCVKTIEETGKAIKAFSSQRQKIKDNARDEADAIKRLKDAKQNLTIQESKIRDRQALEQSLLENLNLLDYKQIVDDLTNKLKKKQAGLTHRCLSPHTPTPMPVLTHPYQCPSPHSPTPMPVPPHTHTNARPDTDSRVDAHNDGQTMVLRRSLVQERQ